jgi:hypothetical protein
MRFYSFWVRLPRRVIRYFLQLHQLPASPSLGGKNRRFRSALLVNDDLLIDFGPDARFAQRFNLSLWGGPPVW